MYFFNDPSIALFAALPDPADFILFPELIMTTPACRHERALQHQNGTVQSFRNQLIWNHSK
jgi:hypothetical protein